MDRGWVRVTIPEAFHAAVLKVRCTVCARKLEAQIQEWDLEEKTWHSWLAICSCERFYWAICSEAP